MMGKSSLPLLCSICLVLVYYCAETVSSPIFEESSLENLVTRFKSKLSVTKKEWMQEGEQMILNSGDVDKSLKWIEESKNELDLLKYKFFQKHSAQIDPDAHRDLTQLIANEGYPVQQYIVQTKDGYLLDLHRIPHGRNSNSSGLSPKPAVFLQHGLLSTGCDWVMNYPKDSLGFLLADNGYDVWIGNSRGNTYSRHHIKYNPNQDEFWDFSFDEMAKYDLTAYIDFILDNTGEKALHYVGHSQGTVMAFALFASQPEYQSKIRLFVGLAPIISLDFMESPIKYAGVFTDAELYSVFGRRDFLPNDIFIKYFADKLCTHSVTKWVCSNIIFLMCGPDITYLNQTRMVVYMNHTPAGASIKDLLHFAQMYRSKRFAMFDYGSDAENMRHYNMTIPPGYDATKVKVPALLFTAPNDWLATPKDVEILESTLPNIQAKYVIPEWNHLDFVWGINAGEQCYSKILQWLPKF